jgi:hypothetical protein
MIKNFEKITSELTDKEKELVHPIIEGFKRYTKENPIKAQDVVLRFNSYRNSRDLTEPRLRKIVNFIRTNGMLPLIATSNGYYVSTDPQEIQDQIKSLIQRSNAILNCANGLQKFLPKK